ncbi:MAG: hypothetical protein J7M40_16445 [Planctomycetes bacterium]|nr:hypothetical protein [Planctomycetota bacterium]
MSDIAKKVVICTVTLAFSLSGIAGPLEAVICLGPNGHLAVEAPHDTCPAGSCYKDPDGAAAAIVLDIGHLASRGDCPHCIDIPFSGGKTHFYTGHLYKDAFDCLPAPHHNSEVLRTEGAQNQSIVVWQTPGPSANGLGTIIMVI